MNGDVRFEGPTAERGTYRVTTHNGDIRVSLGAQANATVFVRTFGGDFSSDFPVTLPDGMGSRDGNKRFNFTLGAGSARVELQSFQGDIHVAKGALRNREQERENARGRKRGAVNVETLGRDVAREVQQEVLHEVGREIDQEIEQELRKGFGPAWQREVEHLRDWASSLIAPIAPPVPPVPPVPPAPRMPRPRG